MTRADYVASDGLGPRRRPSGRAVQAHERSRRRRSPRSRTRGPRSTRSPRCWPSRRGRTRIGWTRRIAAGRDAGPLAGVPFAVKDLFDVAGITTLAGSKINRERPPAARDAAAVAALRRAGAVLVGALNMDEYAYGFTTENTHYGPTRNPHDPTRVAGGSSGGSGAAVGAGLVPLTLGSDTNGSCGCPPRSAASSGSSRPTAASRARAARSSRAASTTWARSAARSRDLTAASTPCRGPTRTIRCAPPGPPSPACRSWGTGVDGLRIAVARRPLRARRRARGLRGGRPVAAALGVSRRVTIPGGASGAGRRHGHHRVRRARNLHLADLKRRARRTSIRSPATASWPAPLVPAAVYVQAQRFRAWYRARVAELFGEVDVLLAPTTPCPAPRIGQEPHRPGRRRGPDPRPISGSTPSPCPSSACRSSRSRSSAPGALPLGVQIVGAARSARPTSSGSARSSKPRAWWRPPRVARDASSTIPRCWRR